VFNFAPPPPSKGRRLERTDDKVNQEEILVDAVNALLRNEKYHSAIPLNKAPEDALAAAARQNQRPCVLRRRTLFSLWSILRDQFESHQFIVFVSPVSNELSNWSRQGAKHGWQGCQIVFNGSARILRYIDNFNFVLARQFLFANLFEVLNCPARPAFLTRYVNPPDMGGVCHT
jgi:hypothetical protein